MAKGVFCLEGLWTDDIIRDQSTIQPILELLKKGVDCNYFYHKCATKKEVEHFLQKWKNAEVQKKFPILYLAFHGIKGGLFINKQEELSLEELGKLLEGKCNGKVFFFASCETLDIDESIIQRFLDKTNAIAAIGYQAEVDWMLATAFEVLVVNALQKDKFDNRGIKKIKAHIEKSYGNLHQVLDFRMVINNADSFPRKRVKE